ncbi:hypothetical protein DFH09DRAFT_1107991 [Mycena vulgaris]|nr:hypothetical protein DFH09DRAFT_1107991 [Mycena vulgaris]
MFNCVGNILYTKFLIQIRVLGFGYMRFAVFENYGGCQHPCVSIRSAQVLSLVVVLTGHFGHFPGTCFVVWYIDLSWACQVRSFLVSSFETIRVQIRLVLQLDAKSAYLPHEPASFKKVEGQTETSVARSHFGPAGELDAYESVVRLYGRVVNIPVSARFEKPPSMYPIGGLNQMKSRKLNCAALVRGQVIPIQSSDLHEPGTRQSCIAESKLINRSRRWRRTSMRWRRSNNAKRGLSQPYEPGGQGRQGSHFFNALEDGCTDSIVSRSRFPVQLRDMSMAPIGAGVGRDWISLAVVSTEGLEATGSGVRFIADRTSDDQRANVLNKGANAVENSHDADPAGVLQAGVTTRGWVKSRNTLPNRSHSPPLAMATLLKAEACKDQHTKAGEILQFSLPVGDDTDGGCGRNFEAKIPKIVPNANGFVATFLDAYTQDRALVIRPNDVWLAILSQFNFFVNTRAELLRASFVSHEGKKELVIDARPPIPPHHRFGACSARDGRACSEECCRYPRCALGAVLLMATIKHYFEYKLLASGCGIPRVTLEGERSDWVKILSRLKKLKEYGLETIAWYHLLRPVIDRFIAVFDKPMSPYNVDFWQRVAHYEPGGSGMGNYYTGWIIAFAPFNKEGRWLEHTLNKVRAHVLHNK